MSNFGIYCQRRTWLVGSLSWKLFLPWWKMSHLSVSFPCLYYLCLLFLLLVNERGKWEKLQEIDEGTVNSTMGTVNKASVFDFSVKARSNWSKTLVRYFFTSISAVTLPLLLRVSLFLETVASLKPGLKPTKEPQWRDNKGQRFQMLLIWAGFFCSAVPGLGSGRDPSWQRVFARLEAPLSYCREISVNLTHSSAFSQVQWVCSIA